MSESLGLYALYCLGAPEVTLSGVSELFLGLLLGGEVPQYSLMRKPGESLRPMCSSLLSAEAPWSTEETEVRLLGSGGNEDGGWPMDTLLTRHCFWGSGIGSGTGEPVCKELLWL